MDMISRDGAKGVEAATALADFLNVASKDEMNAFVEQLTGRTHRTLQQLAFGLFISCIGKWAEACERHEFDAPNESACKLSYVIAKSFGDDWKYLYLPFS